MQTELFHDSIYDALGSAVKAAGGWKVVAGKLWPGMEPASAYAKLKACLDVKEREKLALHEFMAILQIAREKADLSVLQYLCAELSCAPPVALAPKDELQTALQRFDARADELLRAMQAVQRAKLRAAG